MIANEVLKTLTTLEHAGERINGRSYLCEDLISEIHLFRNEVQNEYIKMLDE